MSTRTKTTKAPKPAAAAAAAPKPAIAAATAPKPAATVAAEPTPAPEAAAAAEPAPAVAPVAAIASVAVVEETVEQSVGAAAEQIEKATVAVTQGYGDFAALQKDAFDALVRSGEILAKGAEALGKEYFAFAQKTAEAGNEAAKAMLAAKSVTEFVQLQSDFFRINLDTSVGEGTKLSEMSMKIASEAFEPLQKQMTAAVEAGMKPLAM